MAADWFKGSKSFVPRGRRPIVACHRCGRVGRINFGLVDRFDDGSELWRCTHELPCTARQRKTERVVEAKGPGRVP